MYINIISVSFQPRWTYLLQRKASDSRYPAGWESHKGPHAVPTRHAPLPTPTSSPRRVRPLSSCARPASLARGAGLSERSQPIAVKQVSRRGPGRCRTKRQRLPGESSLEHTLIYKNIMLKSFFTNLHDPQHAFSLTMHSISVLKISHIFALCAENSLWNIFLKYFSLYWNATRCARGPDVEAEDIASNIDEGALFQMTGFLIANDSTCRKNEIKVIFKGGGHFVCSIGHT